MLHSKATGKLLFRASYEQRHEQYLHVDVFRNKPPNHEAKSLTCVPYHMLEEVVCFAGKLGFQIAFGAQHQTTLSTISIDPPRTLFSRVDPMK